ncbi:RidA family protein [Methylibium sp.]|uniref:RidA family protein n=1 Tax=Methylibium sp. TaxID=2067992 RepID=UPI003D097423
MTISDRIERQILPTLSLPAPRFRYSPVVKAGPFVFVSGLIGLDASTGALASGGAHGQTSQVLKNLWALLDEHGWTSEQLIMARIYHSADASPADVNRAWDAAFVVGAPPARSFVGVRSLPLDAAVEIEFQLVI